MFSPLRTWRPARLLATLLCTGLLGLAAPAARALSLTDADGETVTLPAPARRIVSLAPHITELLYAAGAGSHVVGAVQYSDYPPEARQLPRVGGYSRLDLEAIAALKPDLVIGWKSGSNPAHLDRLRALGIPVYVTEAHDLEDVARSLETIGRLAGTETAARAAARAFRARRDALAARYGQRPPVRVFYQIWDQPLMTINGAHLISKVMQLCGGRNVFADLPRLAAPVGVESVLAANPEVVIASGMGEARPEWLDQWKRWPALTATARDNLFFIPPELIQRNTPRVLDGAERLCGFLEQARTRRP